MKLVGPRTEEGTEKKGEEGTGVWGRGGPGEEGGQTQKHSGGDGET